MKDERGGMTCFFSESAPALTAHPSLLILSKAALRCSFTLGHPSFHVPRSRSHGDRLGIQLPEQSFPRAILEMHVARQLDRARAHVLGRGCEPGQWLALTIGIRGPEQEPARHDDAVVGRAEVLLRAILYRPHALLQRGVLHGDALDAAVVDA